MPGEDPGEDDLRAELDRANARLRLLSDVGAALASSLDADEALRRLARLVVPGLAEACVVDLLDGGRVRRVEVAHRDPDTALAFVDVGPLPDHRGSAAGIAQVLAGTGPRTLTDLGRLHPADPLQAAQQDLYLALGAGTVLIVPMQARQQIIGTFSLIRHTGRTFCAAERALAADLGHRAALAVENANWYAVQQRVAEQLQRSLLPDLSGQEHLWLAARYQPARERAEVGGDWYDAFPLPNGETELVIGDVMGHDLTAAVRMSQLRNMLRALAYDSADTPAGVTRRLDRVMQGLSGIELVTAVIATVRTRGGAPPWTLRWTNAGHPPPLLVLEDGTTILLDGGRAPVLGVDAELPRTDAEVELPPGSTLLLYTDGLVERPGEDIDRGLTRLRQQAAILVHESPQVFCDELLSRLVAVGHDDVAVLALRVPA